MVKKTAVRGIFSELERQQAFHSGGDISGREKQYGRLAPLQPFRRNVFGRYRQEASPSHGFSIQPQLLRALRSLSGI